MIFLKLESTNKHQREFGIEVELIKEFIEYFFYEREYSKDSHDRMIIVVKYGNDFFRLKKEENNYFEKWYNSQGVSDK